MQSLQDMDDGKSPAEDRRTQPRTLQGLQVSRFLGDPMRVFFPALLALPTLFFFPPPPLRSAPRLPPLEFDAPSTTTSVFSYHTCALWGQVTLLTDVCTVVLSVVSRLRGQRIEMGCMRPQLSVRGLCLPCPPTASSRPSHCLASLARKAPPRAP